MYDSQTSRYFEEAITFLKEYQWIYKYPNTDIFEQEVLRKVPTEWLIHFKNCSFVDLHNLVICETKDHNPQSLNVFLSKIHELSLPKSWNKPQISYNLGKNCGLSFKKQHEIICLAPVVSEVCEITRCKEVIDVGAGLGYLSFLLSENHDLSVLAIEGCLEKVNLGLKTQMKRHKSSEGSVSFLHYFITDDSLVELTQIVAEKFSDCNNVCICGLHACADLSITILELFLKMKQVKSLVIMPCCYHRLNLEKMEDGKEYFSSFPASKLLKSKFEEHNAVNFLGRAFLRLACQQSSISFLNMNDADHREHAEQLLMRAVLQKAAAEVGCNVSRLKRKTGKITNKRNNFDSYLENLDKTHKLIPVSSSEKSTSICDPEFRNVLRKTWEENRDQLFLLEVLTALQTSIQSVCENILLQDRVQYLIENGVNCDVKQVTDDGISPRCYALVAVKK